MPAMGVGTGGRRAILCGFLAAGVVAVGSRAARAQGDEAPAPADVYEQSYVDFESQIVISGGPLATGRILIDSVEHA